MSCLSLGWSGTEFQVMQTAVAPVAGSYGNSTECIQIILGKSNPVNYASCSHP